MSGGNNTDFWRVLRPTKWPEAPSWMSFSTLMELEICPRRWALVAAEYSDLWNNHGYPPIPQPSALEGTIVHLSLQKITGALVENGCSSLADESAILTLRQLGGFTAIIVDCLEQVLLSYRENPRAAPALDGIRARLTTRVPELRTRIQKFLSRIRPEPHTVIPGETVIHREGGPRHALQHGTYTEVLLQASELGWRGVADMLTLSTTHCEIRDFKTGAPKERFKPLILESIPLILVITQDFKITTKTFFHPTSIWVASSKGDLAVKGKPQAVVVLILARWIGDNFSKGTKPRLRHPISQVSVLYFYDKGTYLAGSQ